MRNLKLLDQKETLFPIDKAHQLSVDEWSSLSTLTSKDRIIVWNGSKFFVHIGATQRGDILQCEATDVPHFCIVTTHGLYIWRYSDDSIETEFLVPNGVVSACFSPEKSTLVFVTGDLQVTLAAVSLDVISSFDLHQTGFGEATPVTVGWGKKETQFHGSAGKQAALAKPELPQTGSQHDDGRVEVVWREDGKYFAVSWSNPAANGIRCIRVFTDTGDLFSTSDSIGQLEPGFCWRPRIQLIAAIQRRPMRGLHVVFFETNAEQHGEFELLDSTLEPMYRVEKMQFHPSGDVLAVLCITTTSIAHGHSAFIRLLTCSNYQWYAKRDLTFGSNLEVAPTVAFAWACDASRSGLSTLYVATGVFDRTRAAIAGDSSLPQTLLRSWTWSLMYDGSDCLATVSSSNVISNQSKNPGFVGVVDGNHVLMTALAYTVIPPPMFATRLTLKDAGVDMTESALFRVASISFPGPWIRTAPSDSHLPLLIQIKPSRHVTGTHPDLIIVQMACGATEARRQTFPFNTGTLEAEWVCGAQHAVPWPSKVTSFCLSEHMKSSSNPCVNRALAQFDLLVASGGADLTHFCWIDCQHIAFVACAGRLVGLLSVSNESSNISGRWLLSLNTDDQTVGNNRNCIGSHTSDLRISGLCNTPQQLLCVQLSDGHVLIYNVDQLFDLDDCISLLPSQVAFDETDQFNSSPLYWTLRLPIACEQLIAARVTEVMSIHTKPLPNTRSPERYRQLLLALNQSSHRLYAASIPTTEDRVRFFNQPGQCKSPTCVMELCSSLLILPNYILVTSMKKVLICVPTEFRAEVFVDPEACVMELVSRMGIPAEVVTATSTSASSGNWYDDFLHPVEMGALLVRALPWETKVILQMPRGNLEEAHPRALVLSHLTTLLDNTQYAQALEVMRRHRVNLNLVYDHNPALFCANLNLFLQQSPTTEPITLFVSELTEEDVSRTIYGKFYGRGISCVMRGRVQQRQQALFNPATKRSKVNVVCDALLNQMKDVKRFLLPVLTCYAKKKPPELHTALLLLKTYHDAEDNGTWESGIRHLQYFATPLELYRVALGTYDLQLALLMAQRTQLDPKEYLAELNELRNIGEQDPSETGASYQRFRIDDQLARYSFALHHLHKAGVAHSDELMEYVRIHKLYREAVELFEPGTEEFKVVSRMWADQLVSEQKLSLSGEVQLRAGLYGAAARTFLSTTQPELWSIAVAQAQLLQSSESPEPAQNDSECTISASEIKAQATKLAARLRDLGRHREAMTIYMDFLQDLDAAITVGLEGGLWIESRRLAALHNNFDRINRDLLPKLTEACDALVDRTSRTNEQFTVLVQRLITLRQRHRDEAESNRLAQLHGNVDAIDDATTETDLFSDTSSISDSSLSSSVSELSLRSTGSRKSGRSAKNKRKQEARKWSSKPGSKYEEVGLMKEISQSIELGQRLAGEASTLAVELWRSRLINNGCQLLACINQLLTEQKAALACVWDEWITGKVGQTDDDQTYEGRKQYPFKEHFMFCAPDMKITQLHCHLLTPNL